MASVFSVVKVRERSQPKGVGTLRAGQFAVADLRGENRMFQFIQFALNGLDEGLV